MLASVQLLDRHKESEACNCQLERIRRKTEMIILKTRFLAVARDVSYAYLNTNRIIDLRHVYGRASLQILDLVFYLLSFISTHQVECTSKFKISN